MTLKMYFLIETNEEIVENESNIGSVDNRSETSVEMKNKSHSKSDEENEKEVSNWDNNNINLDEDEKELESNPCEKINCVTRSKAKEIVRKYKKMKIIDKPKVTCTFPGCGAVLLKRNYKYHLDLHSDQTSKCNHNGCEHRFKTRYHHKKYMIKHVGKYIGDSGGSKFISDSSAELKIQKLRHPEEIPIKCQYCDKCFEDRYELEDHIKRIHHKECPDLPLLVCEVDGCGYQTKFESILNQHIGIHTLPYECYVCHKRFSNGTNLEVHQYVHLRQKIRRMYKESEDNNKNDWNNNDIKHSDSVEDKKELEWNPWKKFKCVTKSTAQKIVRKYKKMKIIDKAKVTCTLNGCGAVVLKRNYKYHRNLHSDQAFKCNDKRSERHSTTRYRLNEPKIKHIGKTMCDSNGCKFISDSSAELKIQKLRHSEERPNKCEYCGKCFKDNYESEDHIKRIHPEECPDLPLLVCEVDGCGYQTKVKAGFNRHKLIHSHPFQCNVCHKRSARMKYLKHHKYIHSEDKPFKCNQCSKSFSVHQNLQLHINYLHKPNNNDMNDSDSDEDKTELESNPCQRNNLRHSEERPIKCKHSDKDKYGLEEHIKRRHPEECPDLPLLVCKVDGCEYQTKFESVFKQHKYIHSFPYVCNVCHKWFWNETNFEVHQYVHIREESSLEVQNESNSKSNEENDSEVSDWSNNNDIIDKRLSNETNLDVHQNVHFGQETRIMQNNESEIINNKTFDKAKVACTFPGCGAVLLKRNYKYHFNLHSYEAFKCNHNGCNKVFKTRYTLRKHECKHLDKFKCDKCNFIGKSSAKLNRHKVKHSDRETNQMPTL